VPAATFKPSRAATTHRKIISRESHNITQVRHWSPAAVVATLFCVTVTAAQTISCPRCANPNTANEPACLQCGTDLRGLSALSDTFEGVALGRVIDSRYMLLSKIGDGGMGSVYRVEHVRMGKVMALKILRPDVARRRSAVDRFRREAKILSKMDHPNAITVFDFGETENGLLYLAMEYVPGRDLAATIHEEGRFEERRALKIAVQVLKALAAAHREGIIHRDVKPGNVMLTRARDGEAEQTKLLDFGIAKLAQNREGSVSEITGGADLVGTPSCMSPEQVRGLELDARSDVYSTTAMLFELLTGRGPFIGGPLEVVSHHLIKKPPTVAEVAPDRPVSDAVEAIIARGLEKDPKDRWQSADDMRRAIEVVLGSPSSYHSYEEIRNIARREDWDAFERSFRRNLVLQRLLAVLVLLAAIGGVYYTVHKEQQKPVVRTAVYAEVEPNDKPSQANLIEPNRAISGVIGARTTRDVSDRDFYELNMMSDGVLTLDVTAVPNINMVVELFAEPPSGQEEAPPIAALDDSPTGMAEQMTDLSLRTGRYLIRLMDKRRLDEPDGPPRENSSDRYSLKLTLEQPRLFQEREPNNEPAQAMPVDFSTPVLGHAGTPGIVAVIRPGLAPFPTWSIDQYRIYVGPSAGNICAVLGGLRWSTLRLTALSQQEKKNKLRSLGSVQVREGRAGGVCVKAADNLFFEVRVDVGNTAQTAYPLAFVHDKSGGFSGLIALVKTLPTLDRAQEARMLVERTLELLPRAEDAAALKEVLAEIPDGESAAVTGTP
jgi:eukaryotic-like serine/threonine-protein kinase